SRPKTPSIGRRRRGRRSPTSSAASSRSRVGRRSSPRSRRRTFPIDSMGGSERPPYPPGARRTPGNPGRFSMNAVLARLERERVFKWLPFVPVQGLFALLLLPNALLLVYLSFLSWRITRGAWWNAPFTGLDSFVSALGDQRFLWALGRTFGFAAVAVPVELSLGFGLALLCREPFRGRRLYTTVFLLPMMIVPAV